LFRALQRFADSSRL